MLAGAARFNAKPKDGIQFFQDNGLIPKDEDGASRAQSLAQFLKKCPRLDKKLLGDFLSRPDNRDVLDAFIRLFDFKDVNFLQPFLYPLLSYNYRKPSRTPCEISFRHFDCLARLSRLSVSLKHLPSATLQQHQVRLLARVHQTKLTTRNDIPEGIKSEDAVFVLAYSVILLNTDLHNPQVRVCSPVFCTTRLSLKQ